MQDVSSVAASSAYCNGNQTRREHRLLDKEIHRTQRMNEYLRMLSNATTVRSAHCSELPQLQLSVMRNRHCRSTQTLFTYTWDFVTARVDLIKRQLHDHSVATADRYLRCQIHKPYLRCQKRKWPMFLLRSARSSMNRVSSLSRCSSCRRVCTS